MILHLKIVGVICIILALVHIIFPRYFNWKQELTPLSLINRQMMQVHTFFVALVVLLLGILCLISARDLVETRLGNQVAFGFFVFWGLRLMFQFFVYSSMLWRGKRFETTVHILFSVLWAYFSGVFFWIYWRGQGQ